MKIIIDSAIPFIEGRLDRVVNVVYKPGGEITHEVVKDADALIIRTRTRCDERLLSGSKVKFIATATIGTDHIDRDYCREKGITVKSAPGCNARGVAQYVFSSLFQASFDPERHSLGIVGYGNVGGRVGKWAKDMGINVMVCDPLRKEAGFKDVDYRGLDELLEKCDAITLHVPLTSSGDYPTLNLIGEPELGKMKRGAILVNSSRGGVTDEAALKGFLRDGKLKAVTDVWEGEPKIDRELLDLSVIATPHIAGYSHEGKLRATRMALEALEEYYGLDIDKSGLYVSSDQRETGMTKAVIEKSYNPSDDSALLKAAPLKFEEIRNSYNYRREP